VEGLVQVRPILLRLHALHLLLAAAAAEALTARNTSSSSVQLQQVQPSWVLVGKMQQQALPVRISLQLQQLLVWLGWGWQLAWVPLPHTWCPVAASCMHPHWLLWL
jgi:hypothetical protein